MKRALFCCISFAAFALFGCPQAATTTCTIIHLADEVCTQVEVPLPDGGTAMVQLSAYELQQAALAARNRRLGDAGP